MRLLNLTEDEVMDAIEHSGKRLGAVCLCKKCKLDIAAIALNNLTPKYVVTKKGYIFSKVDSSRPQFGADLITAITAAIKIVAENPMH